MILYSIGFEWNLYVASGFNCVMPITVYRMCTYYCGDLAGLPRLFFQICFFNVLLCEYCISIFVLVRVLYWNYFQNSFRFPASNVSLVSVLTLLF